MVSESRVMVINMCAFVLIFFNVVTMSSSIQLEREALLNTDWWKGYNTTSDHCKWYGISCNSAGFISKINLNYQGIYGDLSKFNFSCFAKLETLHLGYNQLSGTIPPQIGALSTLTVLYLGGNYLTGTIPPQIGALSTLTVLYLGGNNLTGAIPLEIGNLRNLTKLHLENNNLMGPIPSTLGQLTNLEELSLNSNQLTGGIPSTLGHLSNHLTRLDLSNNNINGTIPQELTQLTQLFYLDLSSNLLSGKMPFTIGGLFKLRRLDLSNNHIGGLIPTELRNCSDLQFLALNNNFINGTIPSQLGDMPSLHYLYLSHNKLSGILPKSLNVIMDLDDHNNLTGPIPFFFGHLSNCLTRLDLSNNNINGTIPQELTQLTQLLYLNLSSNLLSGKIPFTIGGLFNLETLDLSNNHIGGHIPHELAQLPKLFYLYLSANQLFGQIPFPMTTLSLIYLDLSYNAINGTIPSQLGDMPALDYLNLSHNNLSGILPVSLNVIRDLDVSYNRLSGEIPTSFQCKFDKEIFAGNKDLHSSSFCLEGRTSNHSDGAIQFVEIFLPIATLPILIVCVLLFLLKYKGRRARPKTISTKNDNVFSIWNYDGRIVYEDLIEATEDFNIKFCVGTGGYGSVYRAQLPNGEVFALKKLHSQEWEEPIFAKSFKNEIHVLSEIRHRNIIMLYGFCLHNKIMFLVYEYIERGSLFCVLCNDDEATELDWRKRVNIIKGVAHALSYLHHN